jgi:hypothetical protein
MIAIVSCIYGKAAGDESSTKDNQMTERIEAGHHATRLTGPFVGDQIKFDSESEPDSDIESDEDGTGLKRRHDSSPEASKAEVFEDAEQKERSKSETITSRTSTLGVLRSHTSSRAVSTIEFHAESSEEEKTASPAAPPVAVKGESSGASAFASVSIGFLALGLLVVL